MTIDERMYDAAMRLSRKHQVDFKDALEVLCFFNGFLLHNYEQHAEMLIISAKKWRVPVAEMINTGIQQYTRKIHLN